MLVYANNLIGTTVLSMQTAGPIGRVQLPVVDPDSLKVVAFYLNGPLIDRATNLLDVKSIREYSQFGMVVDSIDELVGPDDIVRLSKIIALNFDLISMKVETKRGTRLGRVLDYTLTSDNFTVAQILVKRPLVKSFLDPELTIPRSEIVEITDDKIIVKDEEKTIRKKAETEEFVPNFVNPFRKTEPVHSPAHTGTPDGTDRQ